MFGNARVFLVLMSLIGFGACTMEMDPPKLDPELGVRVSVIHTGDIHSRILPFDMDLLATDERLGLMQGEAPFGGFARAAHVIKKIRANARHVIHVDSGDVFQGAPIFNEFHGEPEILLFNKIGMDGFIIGNHEFDEGPINLYDKLSMAQFPVLAANYQWRPTKGQDQEPLRNTARPYTIVDSNGVKIGIIGMANFSSLSSITYGDSGLGITVLENVEVVQAYIDLLRPKVNIVTMVTHLGLGEDEEVIRRTRGLDVVFGGHLHIVLNPPKVIPDLDGRMVPLVHSGAFMKYVGHFEGVFFPHPEEPWNLELASHDYEIIPIDSRIPADPDFVHMLAPYEQELARRLDLRRVIGYTPQPMRRFGNGGGDSPLGNFLADTMVLRTRVEADFSATNSLGVRADINRGPITNDQLYNVFPFPNTIATVTLSGTEVQELFDFNTYRSTGRGCATQLQVAGIEYDLDCDLVSRELNAKLDSGEIFEFEFRDPGVKFAKNIRIVRGFCEQVSDCAFPQISLCTNVHGQTCHPDAGPDVERASCRCREELQQSFFYKFATNDYMARGGSGFTLLRFNTTQKDTEVDLRSAAIKAIEQEPSCSDRCAEMLGDAYDPARPGTCPLLLLCRSDLTRHEAKWCQHLDRFSPRDQCIETYEAGFCLGYFDQDDYGICLGANYPQCEAEYTLAEVRACQEAAELTEKKCQGADRESPRHQCIKEHAEVCLDPYYSPESEYTKCLAFSRAKAEALCPTLACPQAETDNRQRPIRPRNEAEMGFAGGNPTTIMENLQEAGYDACY